MFGDQGLEDLLDQTRDILAMTGERRRAGVRRASSPSTSTPARPRADAGAGIARSWSGASPAARSRWPSTPLQGPVFHGVSTSLFVRFPRRRAIPARRRSGSAWPPRSTSPLDLREVDGPEPGPIDAAAREEVLVGSVRPDAGAPGGYWIWAVMDNLTRGGALNAVEVAERVGGLASA